MALVPNEVWLHIFSLVSDQRSLRAIALSSRQFYNLALPELLRIVAWHSVEKAEAHLDFFETRVDCRNIPTKLGLTLTSASVTQLDSITAIVDRMTWFANLDTLYFANAHLSNSFYTVLVQLPRLRNLSLHACHLASPPLAVLPNLSPNPSSPAVNLDIPVTHLTVADLSALGPVHIHTIYRHLLAQLQNLVSLTLKDQYPVLVELLPALTSLSICALSDEHAVSLLNERFLPSIAANLLHLRVDVADVPPDSRRPVELVEISAPSLQSFTGSLYLANCLLRTAPNLSSITISTVVKKTQDALAFIETASAAPIEDIELRVEDWDDEVLLAITHRLPSCRRVKLFFYYSQPSDDFLFHLGVQHLPSLPYLHTLHVHAVPIPPPSPVHQFRRRLDAITRTRENTNDDTSTAARIRAVDPEEESCEEYLAVWKKYNPKLRAVKFVKGREWRREGEGGRLFVWSLQDVGERDGEGAGVEEEEEEGSEYEYGSLDGEFEGDSEEE
ncbi:hypothetical protein R3P38DRAFT_2651168 [Favolaschia claudopus]|uniref:F-box domain-containing protein n=1 Tax=Favolaschia claudopus TaxID=2862362 RepID=A0AAW0A2W5_9AGAR